MKNPRATSTGPVTTGAWFSLAGDDRLLPDVGPVAQRLHRDPRVQRAFDHLHRCGSRAVGEFVAELLDALHIAPSALDRALDWQGLDPGIVSALGADRFPPLRMMTVPQ